MSGRRLHPAPVAGSPARLALAGALLCLALPGCSTATTPPRYADTMAEPAAPAGDPATSPGSGLPTGDDSAPVKGPHSCTLRSRDGQPRPDLTCTPSAINPAVSRADIGQTIRAAGWTRTVRPAVWITDGLGQRLDLAYGLPMTNQGELDHGLSGGVARTEHMCAGQIASVMPVTRAA